MKCNICNKNYAHRNLELRGMENVDVCKECENDVMNLNIVLYKDKFHEFSELKDSEQQKVIKQYISRILKEIIILKSSIDTDEIINFTKEKIEQRHRKYKPLVKEMNKHINKSQAKDIISAYYQEGEIALTKINKFKGLKKFIKDTGMTYYEVIHCLSEITRD